MTDARAPSSDDAWVDADKIRFRAANCGPNGEIIGEWTGAWVETPLTHIGEGTSILTIDRRIVDFEMVRKDDGVSTDA